MQLFSDPQNPQSHRVRIVLAAKEVQCRITMTDNPEHQADMMLLNPEGVAPTFHDRGMTLTEPRIIMEYLDDRFPHPPLMPIDPIDKARARVRLLLIERNLYEQLAGLKSPGARKSAAAREAMTGQLRTLAEQLRQMESGIYLCGGSITMLDASLLPILWRLESYQITLSRNDMGTFAKYVSGIYAEKLFQRSLTDAERGMYLPKRSG